MTEQNDRYTENVVTSAITSKLASVMVKDADQKHFNVPVDINRYENHNPDEVNNIIKNSTIHITDVSKPSNASVLINANIGAGKNRDERQYLIDETGITTQQPNGSNTKTYKFKPGISQNFYKFIDNVTLDKLKMVGNKASTRANNTVKDHIDATFPTAHSKYGNPTHDDYLNGTYNVYFNDKKSKLNIYQYTAALLSVGKTPVLLDPNQDPVERLQYVANKTQHEIGWGAMDDLYKWPDTRNAIDYGGDIRLYINEPENLSSINSTNDVIKRFNSRFNTQAMQHSDAVNNRSDNKYNTITIQKPNGMITYTERNQNINDSQLSLDFDGLDDNSKQL